MILELLFAAAASAQFTVGQSTGTIAASSAPVVGVSTATVSLTTAPLNGGTTGLTGPTVTPGPSYTPPGAVPQGYNGSGASFVQPGTLTPQIAPGTTPSGPIPPPNPITPTTPTTTPKSAPPATATPQKQSMNSTDKGSLRSLDEENVERHKRLHEQYLARRRLLTDSDDWKFSSWSERRGQLRSLKKEYEEREEWLRDDYLQKREGLLRMSQGGFDDLRLQGAD